MQQQDPRFPARAEIRQKEWFAELHLLAVETMMIPSMDGMQARCPEFQGHETTVPEADKID